MLLLQIVSVICIRVFDGILTFILWVGNHLANLRVS
jgi:hypothetical protein